MATTVTTAAKTVQASATAGVTTHCALLNASGVECSSSGYARQAIVWGTAAGGAVSFSGTLSFTVKSFTVAKVAGYSAISGGMQYLTDDVTPTVYGSGGGIYTVDSGTLTIGDPA